MLQRKTGIEIANGDMVELWRFPSAGCATLVAPTQGSMALHYIKVELLFNCEGFIISGSKDTSVLELCPKIKPHGLAMTRQISQYVFSPSRVAFMQ